MTNCSSQTSWLSRGKSVCIAYSCRMEHVWHQPESLHTSTSSCHDAKGHQSCFHPSRGRRQSYCPCNSCAYAEIGSTQCCCGDMAVCLGREPALRKPMSLREICVYACVKFDRSADVSLQPVRRTMTALCQQGLQGQKAAGRLKQRTAITQTIPHVTMQAHGIIANTHYIVRSVSMQGQETAGRMKQRAALTVASPKLFNTSQHGRKASL